MPTVPIKRCPVFCFIQTNYSVQSINLFPLIAVHLSMHIPINASCCVSHTPIITPVLADHAGGKT